MVGNFNKNEKNEVKEIVNMINHYYKDEMSFDKKIKEYTSTFKEEFEKKEKTKIPNAEL